MQHIFFLALLGSVLFSGLPQWYYELKDYRKQKKAFIEILLPMIEKENASIKTIRKKMITLFDTKVTFTDEEKTWLSTLAKKYRVSSIYDKKSLLAKIDTIPTSLVLSQAAIESGWGKSDFCKKANNIFGHWDYSGKGLIPKNRDEGKTHTIKIFPSIADSLRAYMLNLNRNLAYKEFREKRYFARLAKKSFTGLEGASTLFRYSEMGEKYVKILVNIINKNNLKAYD